jgi:hypothetical protein
VLLDNRETSGHTNLLVKAPLDESGGFSVIIAKLYASMKNFRLLISSFSGTVEEAKRQQPCENGVEGQPLAQGTGP